MTCTARDRYTRCSFQTTYEELKRISEKLTEEQKNYRFQTTYEELKP